MTTGINLDEFERAGTVSQLRDSRCSSIPAVPGVYLVVREDTGPPQFLECSRAGWYKHSDPSYPLGTVMSNWVPGSHVLYVGMTAAKRGLERRIRCLIDFGSGRPVAHRGGRMLWHLADSESLVVYWRESASANEAESILIDDFREVYGARPFANMAK